MGSNTLDLRNRTIHHRLHPANRSGARELINVLFFWESNSFHIGAASLKLLHLIAAGAPILKLTEIY